MCEYRSLENISLEVIYETFIEAFSDYQVKLDLSFIKFKNMMVRRGFVPKMSIGIFDNDRLVGLILNGVRVWNGKMTAYDLGTGVIAEYRKRGLTGEALKVVKKLCREKGIEYYLLEVLQGNTGAVELYKKSGFKITREFDCYILKKGSIESLKDIEIRKIELFSDEQWGEIEKYCDYSPSWQNSVDSIKACPDKFCYYIVNVENDIAGYGVIEKITGDIPQIAVRKEYRNQGIGRSILNEMVKNTEGNQVKLLNVDCRDEGTKQFLLKAGAVKYVSQYEMVLNLDRNN